MSSHKKVKFDADNYTACFIALLRVHSQIQHATVSDRNRVKFSVMILGDAVFGYVPRSTDNFTTNPNGGIVFSNIVRVRSDWLHFKATWHVMGINGGALPEVFDRHGNPALMTMNGIPIDISDVKVISALNKLTNFPPDITAEALSVIQKSMEEFIECDIDGLRSDEPLAVLHLLQSCHIKTQNKLYLNKARIKEALHASMSKMVLNHAESIAMKSSVKLNSAMLETAECMLTGSKDNEWINTILENYWHLINKSPLLPTHKHEMTSLIMNMRRDCDLGQHMELDHVLNQIVSVFSNDDEHNEELAAMMASDEPLVVRTGYHPTSSNQNSSDTQGLAHFQDTLEKILKMVCDVKSELGHVRKSTCPEHTKNVDASVQRRKQFEPRNNDK